MENQNCSITLQLRNFVKGIPYPEVDRGDSANHGFKVLKGASVEEISLIPEAKDNSYIIRTLILINDRESALFSVGCEKAFNYEPDYGHWVKGYIEFSINLVELVKDAQFYFKLFFDFNQFAWKNEFDLPVSFHWEIDRAVFTDANNLGGFTAAVWITTTNFSSAEEAKTIWEESLDFLADFLSQNRANKSMAKIY